MSDLQPAIWDRSVLKQLSDINGQLLETLARQAAARVTGGTLVNELRAEWLKLTAEHRVRLAACPYLFIDAGFADSGRWLEVAGCSVRDVAPACRAREGITLLAPELLRPTLMLAWHLARSNPLLARIALGMNQHCATLIGSSRLQDLDLLAETSPPWIRVRWEDRPEIWRQLIRAATHGDTQFCQLQLRGLQLLAAAARQG